MAQKTFAFVGCLNRDLPYFPGTRGQGIAVYSFDPASGRCALASETVGIDNPSYLTVHPGNRCLYAVSEVFGWNEGTASAYRFDPADGRLTYINKQPTLGSIAAHCSFDRSGGYLLVANYSLGDLVQLPGQAVAVFPIRPDGGLAPAAASVAHEGTGPDPERQERPHPHCVLASPDNRFLAVADLGIDKLMTYRFAAQTGGLSPGPVCALKPASGPRHIAFHPNGRLAFVINELDSTLASLRFEPERGAFAIIDTLPTVPAGTGANHCAALQVSQDGRFVYGSNRGHDSIVIFAVDPQSGRLDRVGIQSTLGQMPRSFTIDPSGNFLLAANQKSDSITIFAIDRARGTLADTGERISVGTPMCVELAQF